MHQPCTIFGLPFSCFTYMQMVNIYMFVACIKKNKCNVISHISDDRSVLQALGYVGVENLVIPSTQELDSTWTSVFGFKPREESSKLRQEMRNMSVLIFPATHILLKPILLKPGTYVFYDHFILLMSFLIIMIIIINTQNQMDEVVAVRIQC